MGLKRIEIRPFFQDQQQIFYWGRLCGYCGDKPGMKMSFLAGNNCLLTTEERADVIAYVQEQVGEVRETYENREAFHVLNHRRHPASG